MSDLHKQFLSRVRKQEQALGLGLLSEDTETSIFTAPLPAVAPYKSAEVDTQISEYCSSKRDAIFLIQRKYNGFQTYYAPGSSPDAPIYICHHGAGSSGLSFTLLAEALQHEWATNNANGGKPGVFAFDARGHGESDSLPHIYLLQQLTDDFATIFANFKLTITAPKNGFFFVGHSLGGSVLTNYILQLPKDSKEVAGLIMLDIVEETATQSLTAMPLFIKKRPVSFNSLLRAVDWHTKETRLLHNLASARISVPALLYQKDSLYYWHADLAKTQPFWETWFKGLSNRFITCSQNTAKLLILAGHENLDTDLIIGQMQGKYQLIAFNNTPHAGHFIHEDIPKQIAISLVDFVKRNVSPEEYMKKELGFLPKWGGKINS